MLVTANSAPVTTTRGTTMSNIVRLMRNAGTDYVAVMSSTTVEGIVTETDVVNAIRDHGDLDVATAQDWMTPMPDSIGEDRSAVSALRWMVDGGYRHLCVTSAAGELIAVKTLSDVVNDLLDS